MYKMANYIYRGVPDISGTIVTELVAEQPFFIRVFFQNKLVPKTLYSVSVVESAADNDDRLFWQVRFLRGYREGNYMIWKTASLTMTSAKLYSTIISGHEKQHKILNSWYALGEAMRLVPYKGGL